MVAWPTYGDVLKRLPLKRHCIVAWRPYSNVAIRSPLQCLRRATWRPHGDVTTMSPYGFLLSLQCHRNVPYGLLATWQRRCEKVSTTMSQYGHLMILWHRHEKVAAIWLPEDLAVMSPKGCHFNVKVWSPDNLAAMSRKGHCCKVSMISFDFFRTKFRHNNT